MILGFGYMRLPALENGQIDEEKVCRMADAFLAAGGCYFDLARVYLDRQCEGVFRRTVAERYPRDRYQVANKLSGSCYEKEEELDALFEDQLRECGVGCFDRYLVHCINKPNYEKANACNIFEHLTAWKAQGKIKKLGFSFHDSPELLEKVLIEHPEMEFVQIQMNYMDWEDASVQSRRLYELCRRYGREIIVMEPVRGGLLAELPLEETAMLREAGLPVSAEAALRFVAEKEGIVRILSGMSAQEQVEQNTALFQSITPLSDEQEKAVLAAAEHYRRRGGSGCTACGYCLAGCPKKLNIPGIIACLNEWRNTRADSVKEEYLNHATTPETRASACIGCGKCEQICPQKQFVRKLMKRAARHFEEIRENE